MREAARYCAIDRLHTNEVAIWKYGALNMHRLEDRKTRILTGEDGQDSTTDLLFQPSQRTRSWQQCSLLRERRLGGKTTRTSWLFDAKKMESGRSNSQKYKDGRLT